MTVRAASSPLSIKAARWAIFWALFFLICIGLGYPTLNRYDPRSVPGLSDSIGYFSTVAGGRLADDEQHRILVPYVARPVYRLVNGRLYSWNPIAFALLVSNSFFMATAGCLLAGIALRITGSGPAALLSAFLYLANFAVANWNLAGYVDSAVNCLLLAVVCTLLTNRWWPLLLWGALGALAKETFVPLAAVLAFVWWMTDRQRKRSSLSQLAWVAAMTAAGFVVLALIMPIDGPHSTVAGFAAGRWNGSGSGYLYAAGLFHCLFSRETLYTFAWLLPLGIGRLRRVPAPWVRGAFAAALAACAMGAYDDARGNYVRAAFSAIGPLLSLSAALLLVEIATPTPVAESSGC